MAGTRKCQKQSEEEREEDEKMKMDRKLFVSGRHLDSVQLWAVCSWCIMGNVGTRVNVRSYNRVPVL